ncbi:glycosyltransferase 87 family protein [Lysobacter korlensis]|uniref:Glycosyltransferase 87 family protein n=1 Tax=Lysobacter korlensis TaxID=553636 RepID=A0ABV6RWD3_9GAMM
MTRRRPALAALAALAERRLVLWAAFALLHLWLGLVNLTSPSLPLGDVSWVYRGWIERAVYSDYWVGIHAEWVYPILALLPMLAAAVAGFEYYSSTWLTLVLALNAGAFALLTGVGRTGRNQGAAWWWLAFLALLGPIAIGRLDAVTVPLALVAVLWLRRRPAVAGVLLAVAAWMKVWPAALVLAAVVALRDRARVLVAAGVTSLLVLLIAQLYGSGLHVFSFLTTQADRGMQIEAPVATPWLWHALATGGTRIYYDTRILTFQVDGPGVGLAASLVTPALALAVLAVLWLGWRAFRAGAAGEELFPVLALALVVSLVAVNKVGSPQFVAWLAVPVLAGTLARARPFRVPAALTLMLAGLTQIVYPHLYGALLALHPLMLVALTMRNLLYFVLLAWAVRELWRLGARGAQEGSVLAGPSRNSEPALTLEP